MSVLEQLTSTRERYHIRIRKENRSPEVSFKLKRLEFIQKYLSSHTSPALHLDNLCSYITQDLIDDTNRHTILSKFLGLLSTKVQNLESIIPGLLNYIFQRIDDPAEKEQSELRSLLHILILIIFEMSNISLYEDEFMRIARMAISTNEFRTEGMLLLVNLSSFESQFVVNSLCSEEFLGSILEILQDGFVTEEIRGHVLTIYENLLLDPESDIEVLVHYFRCVEILIRDNSNDHLFKDVTRVLIIFGRRYPPISRVNEFNQMISLLVAKSKDCPVLMTDVIYLLKLTLTNQESQNIQHHLSYGLITFLMNYSKLYYQRIDHKSFIRILIEVQKYIHSNPTLITIQDRLKYFIIFYCSEIDKISCPRIRQQILELISQYPLERLVNEAKFVDGIELLRWEELSSEGQLLLIDILRRIQEQHLEPCSTIQETVIAILRDLISSRVQVVSILSQSLLDNLQ